MKKWWVKVLIAVVIVLAAVWLTILGSTVSSRNKVEEYKDQLRAAGEKLTLEEIVPPRLPPGQNSATIVQEAMNRLRGWSDSLTVNPPPAMRMIAPGKAMVGWQQPDIRDVRLTNTWEDVEAALDARAEILDSLRSLPDHPKFDFELDYRQGFNLLLPHLAGGKSLALVLSAATVCDLHRGDTASAVTNLHTGIALVSGWKDEPIMISQLVRMGMTGLMLNPQWELLQAPGVTDTQLALLQRDWTELEFLGPTENALVMERFYGPMTIQQFRTSNAPPVLAGSGWSSYGGSGDWLESLKETGEGIKRHTAFMLWRSTWSQTDELGLLQGNQVLVETVRQIRTNGSFMKPLAERDRRLAALGLDKVTNNWLRNKLDDEMRQMLGAPAGMAKALNRVLAIEISRQLAITAIALKRYGLRHGNLPAGLEELVPEFLPVVPHDPVDGQPMRYRLNADGSFALYSIGDDGLDNGGDPTPEPFASRPTIQKGRDSVWPQPATPEEVQAWLDMPSSER